jgi:hypothetical protein
MAPSEEPLIREINALIKRILNNKTEGTLGSGTGIGNRVLARPR